MHQSLLVPAAFLEILPNEKNMGIAVSTMLKKKKGYNSHVKHTKTLV